MDPKQSFHTFSVGGVGFGSVVALGIAFDAAAMKLPAFASGFTTRAPPGLGLYAAGGAGAGGDDDVACSVAMLFLSSFGWCLSTTPAALSNATAAAAMADEGMLCSTNRVMLEPDCPCCCCDPECRCFHCVH